MNQAINIHKSNKGVTKEIEHISKQQPTKIQRQENAGQENEQRKDTVKL